MAPPFLYYHRLFITFSLEVLNQILERSHTESKDTRPKIKEESGAETKLEQSFTKVAEAFPPHIGESMTKNGDKIELKVWWTGPPGSVWTTS